MLLAVPAGELLCIRYLYRADRLAVRRIGVADRILPAAHQQITGGTDADVLLGGDVGRGQADVAFGGGHAHAAANGELRASDGVTATAALTLRVVGTERQAAGVVGKAPALAMAAAVAALGVVGHVEHDVLGGQQHSVALGRHLCALAEDRAAVGNQREIAACSQLADAGITGRMALFAVGALAAGSHHGRRGGRTQAGGCALYP